MVHSSARLSGTQRPDAQKVTSQEGHPIPPSSGFVHPRESTFSSLDDISYVLSSSSGVSLLQKFSFPEGYEATDPLPTDRAHHPSLGCFTVYATQLASG